MKKVNVNIRIEKELRDEFKCIAEKNTQTPSALMQKWIKAYIENDGSDHHS